MPTATKRAREVAVINPEQEYTDVAGAARFGHVSPMAIRRYLTNGVLTRYKLMGRTLVKVSELRALIREVKAS